MSWTTPDIAALIEQLQAMLEAGGGMGGGTSSGAIGGGGATTHANVGSYEVPLGAILRRYPKLVKTKL